MSSVQRFGTAMQTEPRPASPSFESIEPSNARAPVEDPVAAEPGDTGAERQREAAEAEFVLPRSSPDPLVATDRYRLTMPYADHI